MITASPSLYDYADNTTASTTSIPSIPMIDWSSIKEEKDKKERFRKKSNKIHINEARKEIFR